MATDVDICNLALAYLGDTASISALSEQSAQAQLCTRFYPIARDSLMEMYTWAFTTKRVVLAQVTNIWPQWLYAYASPNDAVNLLGVLPQAADDDYSDPWTGQIQTRPFSNEIDASGTQIILTNEPNATLRYTALVTDTTQFSPLFVTTLAWHLASMLAGPVLKGDAGAQQAQRAATVMQGYLSKAIESDANQRRVKPTHLPSWIGARGPIRRADNPDAYGWDN